MHKCIANNCSTFILDIDECDLSTDACAINATCSNTEGSYECSCDIGFTGDGRTCSELFNFPGLSSLFHLLDKHNNNILNIHRIDTCTLRNVLIAYEEIFYFFYSMCGWGSAVV